MADEQHRSSWRLDGLDTSPPREGTAAARAVAHQDRSSAITTGPVGPIPRGSGRCDRRSYGRCSGAATYPAGPAQPDPGRSADGIASVRLATAVGRVRLVPTASFDTRWCRHRSRVLLKASRASWHAARTPAGIRRRVSMIVVGSSRRDRCAPRGRVRPGPGDTVCRTRRAGEQTAGGGVVGWDSDEVHLAISVDLFDADHRPEPVGAGDQDGSGHDRGRIGGITEQAPPASLVVLSVQIGYRHAYRTVSITEAGHRDR
jgi:hypothetical protein